MSTKRKKDIHTTFSAKETRESGKKLAERIISSPSDFRSGKKALLIGLEGELGGGKTTFLQGLAKGFGIKQKILSPTFVIMKEFPISNFQFSKFYHIDCYRIEKPKELLDLGFEEIIKNPQNIAVIEWADKIKKILPKNTLWLKFKFINKNQRKILVAFNRVGIKNSLKRKLKYNFF